MFIAVLQFELYLPEARSLKDKRRVVKSLKDRLHREHMVSVAEVATQDIHTRATMALSLVTEHASRAADVMDRITEKLRTIPGAELTDTQRDIIRPTDVPDDMLVDEDCMTTDLITGDTGQ